MSTVEHERRVGGLAVEDRPAGGTPSGAPPIVLLHGLTATRRYVVMGSRTLERAGHRVVLYDARGHGRSDPAPAPSAYGYDDLAADLVAVLDAVGIERAVLAGASMGAHTILRLALRQPERVAGLVVITPAHDPATFHDEQRLADWDRLSEGLRTGGVEGFVAAYDLDRVPSAWRDTVATVLRQRLAAHEHLDAVADALHVTPRSEPFTAIADLAAITAPSVVVASGDEADPGHPFAVGAAYAETIPGARLVTEDEGKSPLAWQGGQLSRVIAELAERAG
ncbi:MAG: alpha/beta hydrolase fold protein [Solirubrobacterales bacterium]|nr:alpha/beta hydrolase fold protein [Solirubrobacterales bacterium]